MVLPGSIDQGNATDLIVHMQQFAEQARNAGKDKSAQQLAEAASLIERQLANRNSSKATHVDRG